MPSQMHLRPIRFLHQFAASRKFKTSIDSNSLVAQRKFTNRAKLSPSLNCKLSGQNQDFFGSLLENWEAMMNTSCSRQGFLSFTDDLRRAGRLIGGRTGRHYRSGSGPCRRHPEPRTSRQSRSSSRAALPSSGCRHTHHHHSWLRWSNNYLLLLPGTSRQYGTCHSGFHQNRHHLPRFKNPLNKTPKPATL
jgi:hypothetical protein